MNKFIDVKKAQELKCKPIVMAYGMTKEELAYIEKQIPDKEDVVLLTTPCVTDCIGYVTIFGFIKTDKISDKDMSFLKNLYNDGYYDNNLFVGLDKNLPKGCNKCDISQFKKKASLLVLRAFKQKRDQLNFSTQMFHVLLVLKAIINKPMITTKEIAVKVEIDARTVLRNIETLKMAGEAIEYDRVKRGWYIENNYSMLISDILRRYK